MTPEERQARIARIQKIERIRALESSGDSAGSEPRPGYPSAPTSPMPTNMPQQLAQPFKQFGSEVGQGVGRITSGDLMGGLQVGHAAYGLPFNAAYNTVSTLAKNTGIPGVVAGANVGDAVMNKVGQGIEAVAGQTPVSYGARFLQDKGILSPQQTQDVQNVQGDIVSALLPTALRNIPKATGSLIPKNLPGRLESSALNQPFKPKKGLAPFDRQAQTAIKGDYSPTRSGIEKLKTDLTTTNEAAAVLAKDATAKGKTIDASTFNAFYDKFLDRFKNSAKKPEAFEAKADVKQRIDDVVKQYPNGQVPIDAAIELKNSLQSLAKDQFGQKSEPHITAYKEASTHLLNEITKPGIAPELKPLGLRQRDLIELQGSLERNIGKGERSPLQSWKDWRALGLVAGGSAVGHPIIGGIAGVAEIAIDNPFIKHKMAVGADRLQRPRPTKLAPPIPLRREEK